MTDETKGQQNSHPTIKWQNDKTTSARVENGKIKWQIKQQVSNILTQKPNERQNKWAWYWGNNQMTDKSTSARDTCTTVKWQIKQQVSEILTQQSNDRRNNK